MYYSILKGLNREEKWRRDKLIPNPRAGNQHGVDVSPHVYSARASDLRRGKVLEST
jgi:hypothetical protein